MGGVRVRVRRDRECERRGCLICSSVSSISSRELKRQAGMCGTGVRPRPRSRPTACATSSKCPNDGSIMLTNASAPGSSRGCEEQVSERVSEHGLANSRSNIRRERMGGNSIGKTQNRVRVRHSRAIHPVVTAAHVRTRVPRPTPRRGYTSLSRPGSPATAQARSTPQRQAERAAHGGARGATRRRCARMAAERRSRANRARAIESLAPHPAPNRCAMPTAAADGRS